MKPIPYLDLARVHEPLASELAAAFERVLRSGRYILGPELEAFEEEFARFCGSRHAVGVASGLDALRWILEASGIGPGDEVIVPAQTFIATFLAVVAVGATPIAVDIDPETGNLDPEQVEAAAGAKVRALIGVDLYGRPADWERLGQIARRHGWLLVEDAAQAHGASLRGRPAGSLADAAAFSFYPAKNLGALGDGGAVTTGDPALAGRIRLLRNYGSRVKYEHELLGGNSRLDELQAALLRVKLRSLPAELRTRRAQAARYQELLAGVPALRLPPADGLEVVSAWHIFAVRVAKRDQVRAKLQAQGIETHIHYPVPPVESPALRGRLREPEPCRAARRQAEEVFSLPLGAQLEPGALERVAEALRRIVADGP